MVRVGQTSLQVYTVENKYATTGAAALSRSVLKIKFHGHTMALLASDRILHLEAAAGSHVPRREISPSSFNSLKLSCLVISHTHKPESVHTGIRREVARAASSGTLHG